MKNVLLLILLATSCGFGQDLGYGKVTVQDFEVESEDKSNDHDALLIVNQIAVNFIDYKQYVSIHQRIRIETEQGLDYATKQITIYQSSGGNETLIGLKGSTYSLVDDRVVESKFEDNSLFQEDLSENYVLNSFTMPDVRIGSVIEYSYTIKSPFPYIDDINLQYGIPTIHLDVSIQLPIYYTYNIVFNPRASHKIMINASDFGEGVTSSLINSGDSDDFDESQKIQQLRISNQTIGFTQKNIPALLSEPLAGDLNKYRAKMITNLAAVNDIYTGEVEKEYGTSWEAVAKTIYDSNNFGDELKKSRFFRKDLELALLEVTGKMEKIDLILKFLKSKVKWNGKYGVFTKEGLKKAYKLGSGNVSEVNLLLVCMLRELGVEAYPVLVSTVDNDIPIFPTREGFDYVIVQAEYEGRKVLLDATEKYAGIDLIPLRAANWKGRLIKEDGTSEWIKLTDSERSEETVLLSLRLDGESKIIGKGQKRLTNYRALRSRITNVNSTQEELQEYIQNNNFGLQIDDLIIEDLKSVNKPITFKYNITYNNGFDKVGDKIYISPLLYEANKESIFKLEKRKLPLDLSFPIKTKIIVNIEIPEGYEVESLPESIKAIYNEDVGYYKYVSKHSNGIISTIATFNLDVSVIQPENYEVFKKFFEAIVSKDAEKIILKKI